ncbi:MAG: hypothetical protein WCK11_01070 [Candidatus Falkowbacteria bacterium]
MLNKKQIIGLCLALPVVLFSYFFSLAYALSGLYIILVPVLLIGVMLMIVGSVLKIKESAKEKSLPSGNSDLANKKIALSSAILTIAICYLSWQIYQIYKPLAEFYLNKNYNWSQYKSDTTKDKPKPYPVAGQKEGSLNPSTSITESRKRAKDAAAAAQKRAEDAQVERNTTVTK